MKIIASAPHFFVTDLMKSLDFYVDILDFEKPRLWGEPPNFAMPRKDGYIVMLNQQKGIKPNPNGKHHVTVLIFQWFQKFLVSRNRWILFFDKEKRGVKNSEDRRTSSLWNARIWSLWSRWLQTCVCWGYEKRVKTFLKFLAYFCIGTTPIQIGYFQFVTL